MDRRSFAASIDRMATTPATRERIVSLDQFRGYTVAGMFLVNFVGSFEATSLLLKHHNNFCSYADTIMPQFFFAVGFAFRLTFEARVRTLGAGPAYRHALRRILALALVALVIHAAPAVAASWAELVTLGPWGALRLSVRDWFQTLMHIAVTSLWVLPVIRASAATRIAFMTVSGLLFAVLSHGFYFQWVQTGGIDGGVLGFLAWTIPVITGSLACDVVAHGDPRCSAARMSRGALAMMLAGWLMSSGTTLYDVTDPSGDPLPEQRWAADPVVPSADRWQTHRWRLAEPPFVPPPDATSREENFWMMSQRAATLSYHVFAAGFALAVYAAFRVACDQWRLQWSVFRTLGTNALAAYILHGMVGSAVAAYVPQDAPGWYVTAAFAAYFSLTYGMLRALEKRRIYITV